MSGMVIILVDNCFGPLGAQVDLAFWLSARSLHDIRIFLISLKKNCAIPLLHF